MPSGVTTLGRLSRFRSAVQFGCDRCERRGRLSVARLLAEHGPDLTLPELRRLLAVDCPKMIAGEMYDACGIHFPGLAG
jgi:hypothetical protein